MRIIRQSCLLRTVSRVYHSLLLIRKSILKTSLVDSISVHMCLFVKNLIEKVQFYVYLYILFIFPYHNQLSQSYSFLPSSISHSLSLFFSVFLLFFQTLSSHNEDSKVMQSASLFNKASNWNSFCQNNAFTITDFTLIRFLNLPI